MRRAITLLAVLALNLGLGAEPSPPQAPTPAPVADAAQRPASAEKATLRGKVVGPDGKPIAGATVRVIADARAEGRRMPWAQGRDSKDRPVLSQTAADGTFELGGLGGKMFRVQVEARDLAPSLVKDVAAGADLAIRLDAGVARSGRVLDLVTRAPVAGATVVAVDPDALPFGETALARTTSGDDGRFVFPHLRPGDFTVEAWSPRHARASLSNFASRQPKESETDGERVEPTVYLSPGAGLAGRVVDSAGKPVEGAAVSVQSQDRSMRSMLTSEGRRPIRTDADGRFKFEGLEADRPLKLTARKDGYSDATTAAVKLTRGTARSDFEITLDAAAALTFRLVDADENAVPSVTVALAPAVGGAAASGGRDFTLMGGTEVNDDDVESLGDGKFRVKSLDAGTFDVTIWPEDASEIERQGVELVAGEVVDLGTLRATPGKRVSGRVLDRSGTPVAGATIRAAWLDDRARRSRRAQSKADGRYSLGGLPDVPLQNLTASAEGFATASKSGIAAGESGVDLVLQRNATIVGHVHDADGSALPSFQVVAEPEAEVSDQPGRVAPAGHWGETFTDPSGAFRLYDVRPGTVTVVATAPDRAPARKSGVVVAPERVVDAGVLTLTAGRTLRGRVLDARDETPVPGASVGAALAQASFRFPLGNPAAPSTISGNDGRFEISGLEPRNYGITVQHADFSPAEAAVEVPVEDDPAEIVVRLARGGTLTGMVRDAARAPVPDAEIMLMQGLRGLDMRTAASATDGRYVFERLAPGSYMAMRAPADRRSIVGLGSKPVTIREGETTTLDFDETAKHQVSGRVLRGGEPVRDVNLFFVQGEGFGGTFKSTAADADGRYTIGLDAPGTYSVAAASGMRFGGASTQVEIPDAPVATVDVVLRSGTIAGRVSDAEGKPVAGAIALARRDGADPQRDREGTSAAHTRTDGSFTIDGVGDGTYRVTVSAPGYAPAEAYPVAVAADSPPPAVDLRLEKGHTLRGRVLDPRGNPVQGAFVQHAAAGVATSMTQPAMTDVNGAFVLAVSAESGPVDIAAAAAGFAPAHVAGVPVGDEDAAGVTLTLSTGARARVLALLPDGKPAMGASVIARPQRPVLGSEFWTVVNQPQPTGADGATVVTGLAAGSHVFRVMLGQRSAETTATMVEGGETTVQVTLP